MNAETLGWVDSHCHLPAEEAEADAIIDRARGAGVDWMVCVGTDLETSRSAVAHAYRRAEVVATVGLHPHDATQLSVEWAELVGLAADPQVVAVGECGLDHHYEHSPGPDLGREGGGLIHTREAWDETFAILDAEGLPPRTVFHCFTGGPTEAEACVARGASVSFSGIVTFKNADPVREAAAIVPADLLLVETDSPYLAPIPFRGQTNEPAWVTHVGGALAAARAESETVIANVTQTNAARLFSRR